MSDQLSENEKEEKDHLRALVEGFIQERLMPKLEKKDKDIEKLQTDRKNLIDEHRISEVEEKDKDIEKLQADRQNLIEEHHRETWLQKAANRVSQIQLVTHALKYTHPDAKGSNLHAGELPDLCDDSLVGTHTLETILFDDVVGNAAALDVYKFLKLNDNGQTILEKIMVRDPVLITALADDMEKATSWIEQFAAITDSNESVSSHKLAKQLYFPIPDGDYHLLSPLFPTSLVHAVYRHLQDALFSDEVKQARQAQREGLAFGGGYSVYPNLAIQKFGGTKPQNISQLNSERHGENWLLPSFPPNWQLAEVRPPLQIKTVFGRWFGNRPSVRELTKILAKFLAGTNYNNVHIRRKRADLVNYLRDELLQFADELTILPVGWTANPECRLDQVETLWLDPGRADMDETFAAHYRHLNWQEEVASRFGNWLNGQLRYHSRLPVGEIEHNEWVSVIKPVLDSIEEELAHE